MKIDVRMFRTMNAIDSCIEDIIVFHDLVDKHYDVQSIIESLQNANNHLEVARLKLLSLGDYYDYDQSED